MSWRDAATRSMVRRPSRWRGLTLVLATLCFVAWATLARASEADATPVAYPRLDPLADFRRADLIVDATILSQRLDSTTAVSHGQEPPTVARIRVRRVFKGSALTVGQIAEVRTVPGDMRIRGYWVEGHVTDYGLSWLLEDGQDMMLLLRRTRDGLEVFRGFFTWRYSPHGWLRLAEASPEQAPLRLNELLCQMSVSPRSRWDLSVHVMGWLDEELRRSASAEELDSPAFRRVLERYEGEAVRRSKHAQWQDLYWLAPRLREPVRRRIVGILAARCDSSLAERARRRSQAHRDSILEVERRARMSPEERRQIEWFETNPNIDHDVFAWMKEPPDPADSQWLMLACMDSTRARRFLNERRSPDETERAAILAEARAWGRPPRNWHPVRRVGRLGAYY